MQDARDWVEYCNGNTSTIWGALRAARGHPEPYNVKIWYLGNEIGWHVPFAWVPQRCGFELSLQYLQASSLPELPELHRLYWRRFGC